MIYIKSFSNYEDFKKVFGLRECGNGSKSRMNKILLGCLRDKQFFKYCIAHEPEFFGISNMADFKRWLLGRISYSSSYHEGMDGYYYSRFSIDGNVYEFYVPDMEIDNNGFCEDGDTKAIRYYSHPAERYYKMKAGKFFTKIMESCGFGQHLPQQAKSWLGEEFLTSWMAYTEMNMPENIVEFHYGNDKGDFATIYNSEEQRGDFHSCMNDEDVYDMYYYSAKCHAAWLTDSDGYVFARCVIFDEVHDETTGQILRLAERQYSDNVEDRYKKMLVDELVKRGLIDGYKQIGASCHDNRAFVLNDGTSISVHGLYINFDYDADEHLSYMDSFVFYDYGAGKAYNYRANGHCAELDTTKGYLDDDDLHPNMYWSSWYEEYLDQDEAVWVENHDTYFRNEDVVEDYRGDYQYEEDCWQCPQCGEWFLSDRDGVYSGITDDYYCCDDCRVEAEKKWYLSHGYVPCDYDGYEVYEKKEDAVVVNTAHAYYYGNVWEKQTMTKETFEDCKADDVIRENGGIYYLVASPLAEEMYKELTLPALVVA